MAQEPMTKKLTRALLAAGCAVFLIASGGVALAQEDDDEAPDTKLFRQLLGGLGLKGAGDNQIEYRERSPLVLPPSTDLPPPAADVQPNAANWPLDPDVQRAKQERAARKKAAASTTGGGDAWEAGARVLRPDQLAPNPSAARRRPASTAAGPVQAPGSREEMSPAQLGYKGGLFSSMFSKGETETAKFTGEPERGSLTDPPAGYLTPSPAQPYGLTPDSAKPKAPTSYMDKRTAQDEGK